MIGRDDFGTLTPDEKRALLAELLRQRSGGSAPDSPLAHGQRSLWFMQQIDPTAAAYNIAWAGRLRASVDMAALDHAVKALVRRHPQLRAGFQVRDGEPRQIMGAAAGEPLRAMDVSDLTEEELLARVDAAHREPFDLAAGPAFRATLFTRSTDDHVLLLSAHHIVVDGWSLGILIGDLQELYGTVLHGQPEPPAPAHPYTDFIRWQRQLLAGPEGARLREYWLTRLDSPLQPLELPIALPRPPVQTLAGESVRLHLASETVAGVGALARSAGTTAFTVLLAAFKVLLFRYSRQSDIVVGSAASGRTRAEFDRVVGHFVNPLALRSDLSGDPSFTSLLGQIRRTVHDALAHQDYPFLLATEQLRLDRDPSRSRVFQVMFNLHNAQRLWGARPDAPVPLPFEPYPLAQEEGQFDLTLDLIETGGGIVGTLKYNSDLFERPAIERMARHFLTLIDGIVTAPETPIGELPLLTPDERHRLCVEWNATERQYADQRPVHELFELQAARTPDRRAVTSEGESLTYAALNARANQLGHRLRQLGVGPGVLVGIGLERSCNLLAAVLAVLKAGAAYVPLDPSYPAQRLTYMADDAVLGVLVTDEANAPRWRETLPQVSLVLCETGEPPEHAAAANLSPLAGSADVAYVIYTSGSTGKPKGVPIRHGSLTNLVNTTREAPGIRADDVVLAVTTLSFDIATFELLVPLTTGACVVIGSSDDARDMRRLSELIRQSAATFVQATPTTWRMLLEAGWPGKAGLRVLCGGERLPRDLVRGLQERGAEVWNGYGPTETTIYSAMERVDASEGPVTIGRPVANTKMYVVDEHLQLVPLGVPGELCIGGVGLTDGYLHRPELTAERFIPNPFSSDAGAMLYRTGDLARYLPDGRLECLGRIDHQVKIRGFRIETGEVESVLGRHPAIRQVVVAPSAESSGDVRLVAYVTYGPGVAPDVQELRSFAQQWLPEFMVPSAFVRVDAIPTTPSGKIDRQTLARAGGRAVRARPVREPRTATESALANLWRELLKVENVGIDDNFFELGGHSLLATRLVSRIEDQFRIALPVRRVFEARSLAALAAELDVMGDNEAGGRSGSEEGRELFEF